VVFADSGAYRMPSSLSRSTIGAEAEDWATVTKAPPEKVPEAATGPAWGAGVTVKHWANH
jgi:hypothetical protein